MKNFIAFKFTDNDFHSALREAIEYVTKNMSEELTQSNYHKFVTLATSAFHSIRRIDNTTRHGIEDPAEYASRITEYISGRLKISDADKLSELDDSFEGYVYDTHVGNVFYYGGDY